MDIIVNHGNLLLILAIVFGTFMAWGIGANDVANAMGTSVGSGAVTIKQAIIIAVIFEFSGAILAGGEVTATIRKGILDAALFTNDPHLLVYGMMASLLAAGSWLLIASSFGWPVSTTHSIVGAIVGFGAVGVGIDAVAWSKVIKIIISWIASPVLAGIISFTLFRSLQNLIIDTQNPFNNAKKYVPYYMFLVGFIVSLVTIFKGLKHVGLSFSASTSYLLSLGFILILMKTKISTLLRWREFLVCL
jgi:PiT family inorganic phosphate transporter